MEVGLGRNLARTENKCMQNFYGKYLKERDHIEGLRTPGNILNCRVQFVWMRKGIIGDFCKDF